MLLLELPSEDAGKINSSGIHTRRERTTPNANLKVENIRLIGERNQQRLSDTVRERIGEPTIRQNAVLCVEMLLTKAKKKLTTTAKLLTRSNQKLLTRLELAEIKIKSQNIEIKIWKKKYQDSVAQVSELPLEKVVYEARFDPSTG